MVVVMLLVDHGGGQQGFRGITVEVYAPCGIGRRGPQSDRVAAQSRSQAQECLAIDGTEQANGRMGERTGGGLVVKLSTDRDWRSW